MSDGTANQEAKVKHYEDESELEEGAIVGPYQLLAKERLMGIYVAIFIYRGVETTCKRYDKSGGLCGGADNISGLDSSTVTCGLIGGRVGNKGAVALRYEPRWYPSSFHQCSSSW